MSSIKVKIAQWREGLPKGYDISDDVENDFKEVNYAIKNAKEYKIPKKKEKQMSDFKPKEKRGSLFVNQYKTKDTQPTLTGTCTFEGKVYKIAAWENEESNDNKFYYNLRFEEKIEIEKHPLGAGFAHKDTKAEGPNDPGDENEDLPF
tara:strand:+ start:2397 stop:2840 length:444 start_codon:yes stop_codon:yes gene_type:complete